VELLKLARKNERRKWIYLPIEIKARELDSKVLLACVFAEAGYGVVIGPQGFNNKKRYPPGVYFDKSLSPNKQESLRFQTEVLKNQLVCLDEEGLVYMAPDLFLRIRTSIENLNLVKLIFTWGEEQLSMLSKAYPGNSAKFRNTGSPRADIWKMTKDTLFRDRVEEYKTLYGDFILVPSNFNAVIHASGSGYTLDTFKRYDLANTDSEQQFLHGRLKYQYQLYENFLELIPSVAAEYPEKTVIIRPHPGDSIDEWERSAKDWPRNIRIIYEGSISSWIAAASVVIHNSCTSGVEAFVMGRPVLAYMPIFDPQYEQNLPNPLSQQCKSMQDIFTQLDRIFDNTDLPDVHFKTKEQIEFCDRHVRPSNQMLAADFMLEHIDSLEVAPQRLNIDRYDGVGGVFVKIKDAVRKVGREILISLNREGMSRKYKKQKFDGISQSEIDAYIGDYSIALNRFKNITAKKMDIDTYVITDIK